MPLLTNKMTDMYTQTKVQLASAKIGSEFSWCPTFRFHQTKIHITSMEMVEMTTPQKVVKGLWPVQIL